MPEMPVMYHDTLYKQSQIFPPLLQQNYLFLQMEKMENCIIWGGQKLFLEHLCLCEGFTSSGTSMLFYMYSRVFQVPASTLKQRPNGECMIWFKL